ncbi:MAG: LysE family transporter, partial [Myxococcota bacterium]
MLALALIGGLLAFVASLPVTGPGAVLIADAAMRGRPSRGVGLAVGMAIAEAGYATFALLGAAALLEGNPDVEAGAHAIAGLLLLAVGIWLWRRTPAPAEAAPERDAGGLLLGAGRGVLVGFSVVAPNPTLLLSWGTVAAALVAGGYAQNGVAEALVFGLGVAVGAVLSGIALTTFFSRLRARAGAQATRAFNRAAGLLLLVLGAVALVRAFVR